LESLFQICFYIIVINTNDIYLKILLKESLNSDWHQLHQYQQTKQSLLILTGLTEHKMTTTTYDVGNQGHGFGQA
jgi:hypothetical protein